MTILENIIPEDHKDLTDDQIKKLQSILIDNIRKFKELQEEEINNFDELDDIDTNDLTKYQIKTLHRIWEIKYLEKLIEDGKFEDFEEQLNSSGLSEIEEGNLRLKKGRAELEINKENNSDEIIKEKKKLLKAEEELLKFGRRIIKSGKGIRRIKSTTGITSNRKEKKKK